MRPTRRPATAISHVHYETAFAGFFHYSFYVIIIRRCIPACSSCTHFLGARNKKIHWLYFNTAKMVIGKQVDLSAILLSSHCYPATSGQKEQIGAKAFEKMQYQNHIGETSS